MDLMKSLIISGNCSDAPSTPSTETALVDLDLVQSLLFPETRTDLSQVDSNSASPSSQPNPDSTKSAMVPAASKILCECTVEREKLMDTLWKWPQTGVLVLNACDRTCRFCLEGMGYKVSSRNKQQRNNLSELVHHIMDFHILPGKRRGHPPNMPGLIVSGHVHHIHRVGDPTHAPDPVQGHPDKKRK
ncbi:uncharacterized protein BDZ99DRAFT_478741 [Mytilinidion resinicola]|uniref:Uncharacterized protein n=1 Tax=Mytilinidion resinicola TaxID=574789 RepID=A0A6A6YEI8_9PEZI|nr:uncharacterized protein BDZ99DRAFT_478741 [Mytilinidion resinicola]KAF2807236.1 hypothetical protein BDZ99DRAFT_478741 [Mytilinidion resinicola]